VVVVTVPDDPYHPVEVGRAWAARLRGAVLVELTAQDLASAGVAALGAAAAQGWAGQGWKR
jgi:hypothetical protein